MKARVRIGYHDYVMDLDDAVVLIKTYEKMIPLESEYVSGQGNVWYIKDAQEVAISLTPMTDDQFAVIKMRGKKSSEPPF
jgi:hypothetical protein